MACRQRHLMLGLQALPDGVRGGGLRSGKHAGAPRSVGVVLLRAGNKDTLIDLVGERDAVLGHIQERRSSAGERRLWPAPVLAPSPACRPGTLWAVHGQICPALRWQASQPPRAVGGRRPLARQRLVAALPCTEAPRGCLIL